MWWLSSIIVAVVPLADDVSFQEGMRLYEDFEYERAVFRFKEALRADHTPTDRATIHVWLGLGLAELGDLDGARASFVDAHAADPQVKLPDGAAPKVAALFDEARAQTQQTPPPIVKPDPPPPPPPPVAAAPQAGTPWLLIASGGIGAGAALLLGGGAVAGGVALAENDRARATLFQDDAARANASSRDAQLAANVLYGAGAVSAALAGGLFALHLMGGT